MAQRLKALTFDWWGTLYTHRDARPRRIEALSAFLEQRRLTVPADRLDSAYKVAIDRYNAEWRAGNVFLPSQWLRRLFDELGLSLPPGSTDALCREMEEAVLVTPPLLAPGAGALIVDLHRAGVRLGLISDTGLTVGRVMRRILEMDGLLPYFTALVFSDESGVTKPHRIAFAQALERLGVAAAEAAHVGDLPETDIIGAKMAGMRAVLITGISQRADDGLASAVVRDFGELRDLCRRWGLLPTA